MNRADVLMVNESLDSLGNSLLKNRMLEMQQKEAADRGVQQGQQLALADKRIGVDQARQNAAEAHYHQMEKGQLDANTARLKQQDVQDKQQLFGQIVALNSAGAIDDLEPVNKWLASDPHFAASGIQLTEPTKKAGFQTAPVANKAAWDKEYAKAAALEASVAQHGEDSLEDQAILAQAALTRKVADAFFNPAAKPAAPAAAGYREDITNDTLGHPISRTRTPIPAAAGNVLDATTAAAILKQAGGDKNKARAIAKARGYAL